MPQVVSFLRKYGDKAKVKTFRFIFNYQKIQIQLVSVIVALILSFCLSLTQQRIII